MAADKKIEVKVTSLGERPVLNYGVDLRVAARVPQGLIGEWHNEHFISDRNPFYRVRQSYYLLPNSISFRVAVRFEGFIVENVCANYQLISDLDAIVTQNTADSVTIAISRCNRNRTKNFPISCQTVAIIDNGPNDCVGWSGSTLQLISQVQARQTGLQFGHMPDGLIFDDHIPWPTLVDEET